ncbi:hypothetical protein [Pseudodesulfovibrio pelocollis]|uniref:hypothetical protein n=1 Tax=Pseudodesulfovibrio pelocollis TaxID=3051432 RepID=UPI00255B0799|nr:hypothetical protein [Pseudodesulfovibrio sp. SB368]
MSADCYDDTIYGQILPVEREDDDEAGLMILVDGEEEFLVEPDKNGLKLMDHMDQWVTAQGTVTEEGDELLIRVRDFTLDDDWNFGDDDNW